MRRVLVVLAVVMAAVGLAPGNAFADEGPFLIENVRSHQCLNQDYSNNVQHQEVIAYRCDTSFKNELWTLVPVGSGSVYKLKNVLSGKCLNQDWSGGYAHSNVIAYRCDNSFGNENWILTRTVNGIRFQNVLSTAYLDQDYSGGTAHSDILAWQYTTTANQYWYES